MKFKFARLGLAALAICIAMPAHAGVSEDFAGCDGLKKPKRKDDGMRGTATTPGYQRVGMDRPQSVLASCDRALARKELRAEQTLRRAHLLRARAAAKLQLGRIEAALADIDSAQAAAAEYKDDFFYDRSMGLSLELLRAIALQQSDRGEEARALAEAAAAKRPYVIQIQMASTLLRDLNHDSDEDRGAIWSNLARLNPAARGVAELQSGESEDFDSLAANAENASFVLPPLPGMMELVQKRLDGKSLMALWTRPTNRAMNTAYALAGSGDAEAARAWVADVRAKVTAAGEAQKDNSLAEPLSSAVLGNSVDPMENVVEARIAISEGRLSDAADRLEGVSLRSTPLTRNLYEAYAEEKAKEGNEDAPELADLPPEEKRDPGALNMLAGELLVSPESERKMIDYKKSRPNILSAVIGGALSMGTSLLGGIDRTSGFRSTPNDDGTVMVEYTGDTTSAPVVQEMTLLRAAELTLEGGHTHFIVTGRKDYARYMTTTQYGMEISRSLAGYKTELTIRALDADTDNGEPAFDAVAVVDDLGPIYY